MPGIGSVFYNYRVILTLLFMTSPNRLRAISQGIRYGVRITLYSTPEESIIVLFHGYLGKIILKQAVHQCTSIMDMSFVHILGDCQVVHYF